MNSSSIARGARALALLAMSLPAAGCYVLQAAGGQASLMAQRRPIDRVIADPGTTPAVRTQLAAVAAIREFATHELHLPDNGSYRQYADIHRAYVVWNVVAAPQFSVQPKRWCFPVAGCVAYRGYFRQRRAESFAAKLRARGFDVTVGGVAAYSTLGHFDDPILSTMLGWTDVQLASIVFHELTHQLLYVKGDSDFNEALASVVEEEGVMRWLNAAGRASDLAGLRRWRQRSAEVTRLLGQARGDLGRLYASRLSSQEMLRRKAARFEQLRHDYDGLSVSWGSEAPLRGWFSASMGNAHLAAAATYSRCVPGLNRMLAEEGHDLPRFYARARELARLPAAERGRQVCSGG